MPKPKTDANKIKELESKLQEAKSIFQAIEFMELSKDYPAKLREAIQRFINDSEYVLKLKREKENDLP